MVILVLSTQRNYIYVNITGLGSNDILGLLIKASKKRYFKIHGYYSGMKKEQEEEIKNRKYFFSSVDSFLKW